MASATGVDRKPTVVADGRGGVIVLFERRRGEDTDVMAQRVSATGQVLWNDGARATEVSSTPQIERRPTAVPDGQGGVVVLSAAAAPEGDHVGDIDLRAAHLDGAGVLTWEEGLKSVSVAAGAEIERDPAAVRAGG